MKRKGINNLNLLQSAINGQQWYSTHFEALCHVSFSVNAYHCFFDENRLSDIILALADGRITDKTIFIQEVKNCIL